MKRSLKASAPSSQQSDRNLHVTDQARDLLLTSEAAAFLRFDGPSAAKNFFAWANRWNVPRLKRGRTCLWQRSVLIAFLERKKWTRGRVA